MPLLTADEKRQIKAVFQELTSEQREHVMAHFDKLENCTIEYKPGKFLACHLGNETPNFKVKIQTEFWWIGEA